MCRYETISSGTVNGLDLMFMLKTDHGEGRPSIETELKGCVWVIKGNSGYWRFANAQDTYRAAGGFDCCFACYLICVDLSEQLSILRTPTSDPFVCGLHELAAGDKNKSFCTQQK